MNLRTRLDVFSAALLSALAAPQLVACGGRATANGEPKGSADGGSNEVGTSTGGAATAGTNAGGAGTAGASTGGAGASSTGSGQSGEASAGSAGVGFNRYPCTNPQDLGHGFVQCDGFVHRQRLEACASHVPRPELVPDPTPSAKCHYDSECQDKPYGWCDQGYQIGENHCEYGCENDSDCAGSEICECGEPVGRCLTADCASDADCEGGYLCRAYDASGGCGPNIYTCQSPADTCGNDADCNPVPPPQTFDQNTCRSGGESGHFQCTPGICIIGRPFLVEGAQRLAPVAARADWSDLARAPRLTDVDARLRSHLAECWTRSALLEHASIAAFARFTLQLLSLGAPASLIERATAAMIDETKHAKACFAVASGYAGTALGPGSLDIDRSLHESSLVEIVLNTIREGCVGETIAAIEAREAHEHTTDPALRALLSLIAEDETRHAELAYRFVQWALPLGGAQLERAVRHEFAALAAEAAPARSALTDDDEELLRHGIVPDVLRQSIRERAIAEVILPCSRALFRAEAAPRARCDSAER